MDDIIRYLKYMKSLSSSFGNYSKLYSFTTENIYGFLKNYDLNNKKVLTVAGSGDQRLNLLLMGASDVTCFDINPLSRMQLELKDAAIKNVNYEKFVKFFGAYTKKYGDYYKMLDSRIFSEIEKDLDNDTYTFFNYIINQSDSIKPKNVYFDFFDNKLNKLVKFNNYLEQENYIKLKNIIKYKKINFIRSNIIDLKDNIKDEKYDMILLSNISDYTHNLYAYNDLENYYKLILSLTDNLNMYGIMQVGYIYNNYSEHDGVGSFHNKSKRQKYFTTDIFHTVLVDSYNLNSFKDKVITYQKFK